MRLEASRWTSNYGILREYHRKRPLPNVNFIHVENESALMGIPMQCVVVVPNASNPMESHRVSLPTNNGPLLPRVMLNLHSPLLPQTCVCRKAMEHQIFAFPCVIHAARHTATRQIDRESSSVCLISLVLWTSRSREIQDGDSMIIVNDDIFSTTALKYRWRLILHWAPESQLRRNYIARRHGYVFRMALHNEGDWWMETCQRARQGELSCLHTPIPELCNAILNTCQMPSRFYIIPSNVNKSQTHLLKPFLARDLMEGHICRQNMRQARQLKLTKSYERYHNVAM